MKEKQVVIMRRSVLMEDEGRQFVIKICPKEEARQWIAAQKGEYFAPSDYYIAVPQEAKE